MATAVSLLQGAGTDMRQHSERKMLSMMLEKVQSAHSMDTRRDGSSRSNGAEVRDVLHSICSEYFEGGAEDDALEILQRVVICLFRSLLQTASECRDVVEHQGHGLEALLRGVGRIACSSELRHVLLHCRKALIKRWKARSMGSGEDAEEEGSLEIFSCSLDKCGGTDSAGLENEQGVDVADYAHFEPKLHPHVLWAQRPGEWDEARAQMFGQRTRRNMSLAVEVCVRLLVKHMACRDSPLPDDTERGLACRERRHGPLERTLIMEELVAVHGTGSKIFKEATLSTLLPYPLTSEQHLCDPSEDVVQVMLKLITSHMQEAFPSRWKGVLSPPDNEHDASGSEMLKELTEIIILFRVMNMNLQASLIAEQGHALVNPHTATNLLQSAKEFVRMLITLEIDTHSDSSEMGSMRATAPVAANLVLDELQVSRTKFCG